jgi:hypothetical protein
MARARELGFTIDGFRGGDDVFEQVSNKFMSTNEDVAKLYGLEGEAEPFLMRPGKQYVTKGTVNSLEEKMLGSDEPIRGAFDEMWTDDLADLARKAGYDTVMVPNSVDVPVDIDLSDPFPDGIPDLTSDVYIDVKGGKNTRRKDIAAFDPEYRARSVLGQTALPSALGLAALAGMTPEEAEASIAKLAARGVKVVDDGTFLKAVNQDGDPIAMYLKKDADTDFFPEGAITSERTDVDPPGQGIGTEFYDALNELGYNTVPDKSLTNDGAWFWAKRNPELVSQLLDQNYFMDNESIRRIFNLRNGIVPDEKMSALLNSMDDWQRNQVNNLGTFATDQELVKAIHDNRDKMDLTTDQFNMIRDAQRGNASPTLLGLIGSGAALIGDMIGNYAAEHPMQTIAAKAMSDMIGKGLEYTELPTKGWAGLSTLSFGGGLDEAAHRAQTPLMDLGKESGNAALDMTGSPAVATMAEILTNIGIDPFPVP